MPVNKPVKKRGPYKKKEILPPSIEKTATNKELILHKEAERMIEKERNPSPSKNDSRDTIKLDRITFLILQWLGNGNVYSGLSKVMGYIISLEWETLERLRGNKEK